MFWVASTTTEPFWSPAAPIEAMDSSVPSVSGGSTADVIAQMAPAARVASEVVRDLIDQRLTRQGARVQQGVERLSRVLAAVRTGLWPS